MMWGGKKMELGLDFYYNPYLDGLCWKAVSNSDELVAHFCHLYLSVSREVTQMLSYVEHC